MLPPNVPYLQNADLYHVLVPESGSSGTVLGKEPRLPQHALLGAQPITYVLNTLKWNFGLTGLVALRAPPNLKPKLPFTSKY